MCVCVCVYAHARAGGGRLRKTALGTAKKVLCKDQPLAWETTVLTLSLISCVLRGLFPHHTSNSNHLRVLGSFCPSHSPMVCRGELLKWPLLGLALCPDIKMTKTAPDPSFTHSPLGDQIVIAQSGSGLVWEKQELGPGWGTLRALEDPTGD